MARVIQIILLMLVAIVIAVLHPFQLAMPWQTGSAAEVDFAALDIMRGYDFEITESNIGRLTPFNYVAAEDVYEARGNPAETCTALRQTLEDWGVVVGVERREDGCDIEAKGPGPMTAIVSVTENAEQRRDLRIDIRVQHTP